MNVPIADYTFDYCFTVNRKARTIDASSINVFVYTGTDEATVYDKDGNEFAKLGAEQRVLLEYDELPEVLIDAIVATEDSRFFSHKGVDWAIPVGTKIFASSAGTVVRADYNGGYGLCVLISHPDGRMTRYAHCSKLYVKEGQKVSAGDKIAAVGSTGNSTGPHLHLEIRINGQHVNPQNYLYK